MLALIVLLSPRRARALGAAKSASAEAGGALAFHGVLLYEFLILLHDVLIFPLLAVVSLLSIYRLPALWRAYRGRNDGAPPPELEHLAGPAPSPEAYPAPFRKQPACAL